MHTPTDTPPYNFPAADELDLADHEQPPNSGALSSDAPNSAANWLRWLGAFAVAASAIVFLLQGLNNIDLDMRNWVYLALIATMGACGIASQKFLQDAKGSRLFFGLAVLLVPVQFAQLGGLLHDLTSVAGASIPNLLWLVAGTVLLAVPLAYAGMAILARNDKRSLTGALLVMCAALLVPERDSLIGFVTLAGLAFSTLWLELKVFRRNSLYASLEGMGLRLLLAAPLIIAAVRMSLHIDSVAGTAVMAGIVAVLLSRLHLGKGWLQFIGALLGVASWWVYACEAMPRLVSSDFGISLLLLPSAIWLMDVARVSGSNARPYRSVASLLWVISAASLLMSGLTFGKGASFTLFALLLGVVALVWGLVMSQRLPVLAGAAISVPSIFILVAQSLYSVEVNSWIALGLAGIALVFSASLVEKYGRPLLISGKKSWQTMSAWD